MQVCGAEHADIYLPHPSVGHWLVVALVRFAWIPVTDAAWMLVKYWLVVALVRGCCLDTCQISAGGGACEGVLLLDICQILAGGGAGEGVLLRYLRHPLPSSPSPLAYLHW